MVAITHNNDQVLHEDDTIAWLITIQEFNNVLEPTNVIEPNYIVEIVPLRRSRRACKSSIYMIIQ